MAEGVIKRREPVIRPAPYALLILLPAAEVEAAFLSLYFIVSSSAKYTVFFALWHPLSTRPAILTFTTTDKEGVQ